MEKTFKADSKIRLDSFLKEKTGKSRSSLQRLIKEGYTKVNGKEVKPSYVLNKGDIVYYSEKKPVELKIKKEEKPLKIVYEDENLLIIDKEAGLIVHPVGSKTTSTLVNRLLFNVKDLSGIGGVIRPGIVHRLDRDTSGLMVVAKNDVTHIKLSEMLKEHLIKRKYIALVRGIIHEKRGTINIPIKKKLGETKMKVSILGKEAITHFKTLEIIGNYTLVQIQLETGRTHQIRVHFAHLGHPLIGDYVYGGKEREIKLSRQFLHSYEISFTHPIIGRQIRAVSELPEDLKETLKKIREKWKR